jgi:kynurenine formamidase
VAFPVHQELIARNGIYIHENVATERLAADNVTEFAYSFAPMPIKGGTGAPGNAMAIR